VAGAESSKPREALSGVSKTPPRPPLYVRFFLARVIVFLRASSGDRPSQFWRKRPTK
jgi:hypothetical protein